MLIYVLTLFPEMILAVTQCSILKRGQSGEALTVNALNIRDFTTDKHRMADDIPYGGGPGMVMKPEPIAAAIRHIKESHPEVMFKTLYLSPQGKTWNQTLAKQFTAEQGLILLCGHYEGIDQRIIDMFVDEEISIGDFVLTGGEIPALCLIDSIARLLPGVLGNFDSALQDSFGSDGLLDHPHYTRPETFEGQAVPEVLRSGHHAKINEWRRHRSIANTLTKRPDLIEAAQDGFDKKDRKFLKSLKELSDNGSH